MYNAVGHAVEYATPLAPELVELGETDRAYLHNGASWDQALGQRLCCVTPHDKDICVVYVTGLKGMVASVETDTRGRWAEFRHGIPGAKRTDGKQRR